MRVQIDITPELWRGLLRHLFRATVEAGAFLLAEPRSAETGVETLHVRRLLVPAEDETAFASRWHLSIDWDFVGRAIAEAWADGLVLVEVHSHVEQGWPAFSASDVAGLLETVTHVKWRTRGATYAALVLSPGGFDGLAWPRSSPAADGPIPIRAITVGSRTIQREEEVRYDALY